jgi:PAS domain S-box-containing protein
MNIRSIILLILLIGAGFLGNYHTVPLFFGADFLFGSIAVLLVLYFYGLGWGLLAAVLVHGYTYVLWGHPYGFINFVSEALFVGLFLKRGYRNLLALDGAFWLLLGMPLAWFYHGVALHMDGTTASFIMLKQGVNGVFNAMLASLAICFLPLDKLLHRPQPYRHISLQESLFNLLVMMVLLPTLLLTMLETRHEREGLEAEVVSKVQSISANLRFHLHFWFQQRLQAVQYLSRLAAVSPRTPTLQLQHETDILNQALPDFIALHVENVLGRTIAFSPIINEKGEATIGHDFADRPWFKEAKTKKQLVISGVFRGRIGTFSPIIVITAPVMKGNRWFGTATGTLDLSMVRKMLEPYSPEKDIVITLTDSHNQVIASTAPERTPMQFWDRRKTGVSQPIKAQIYRWSPGDPKLPSMTRWKESFYVQEISLGPEPPWKLIIEAAVAPLQQTLYTMYVKNLSIVAILTGLALFFSLILSRWLTRPLAQLSLVTADLPEKLSEAQEIDWPVSSTLEINSLIANAKSMACILEENFQKLQMQSEELRQANSELLQEIQERYRAEEALRESEARHSTILQTAMDGFWRVDLQGRLLEVNEAYCRMSGYSAQELLAMDISGLEAVMSSADIAVRLQQVISQGEDFFETLHRCKDGSIIDLEVSAQYKPFDGGSVVVFLHDITERKRADELLKLNELRLEALVTLNQMANAPLSEITLFAMEEATRLTGSKIGYVAFMNEDETVLTMHAWSKAAMAECRIADKPFLYPVENTGLWGEAVRQRKPIITNDYAAANPWKKGYPQGHVNVIRHMNVPIFDDDKVVIVAGVGNKPSDYNESDIRQLTLLMEGMWHIVQRKRAEEAKLKLEAQLVQAQKMEAIGTLAGGIAHDFNNILGAITGFAELTLQSVPKDSQEYYNLKQVLKAGERARDLVKQILIFSRRAAQEKKPIQISSVIKEALKLLRASLPTTIEIKQNLAVPAALVLADPTQIHQILMNLGANAAHAMREDGGFLEVSLEEVSLDRDDLAQHPDLTPGPYVQLTVRDTGQGMDQEIVDRVFEPFFTTKEVGDGTGMGLAVVHGIVKSSGGEIKVSSRPGNGTAFIILLPKVAGEVATASAVPAPLPTGTGSILFIDDEEMLVNVTREMLKKLGYRVVAQTSSLEALKIFQTQPEKFDLVITDQTMPHMTGMQLAEEFRHIRPDIPIILCTGFSEKVSAENIRAAGINDLLLKPIVMRNLAETVKKVLA